MYGHHTILNYPVEERKKKIENQFWLMVIKGHSLSQ